MEIVYKNKSLERICNDFKKAKKEYGEVVAEKLLSTINRICAAENLVDIRDYLPMRFHPLKGDRVGTYALDLGKKLGYRLILRPIDSEGNSFTNEEIYNAKELEINIIKIDVFSKLFY